MSTNLQLNELVGKYYWYTVDHRNIHIKIIVKTIEAKVSYGKERVYVIPLGLNTNLIKIPDKGFWVEVNNSTLEPIDNITALLEGRKS